MPLAFLVDEQLRGQLRHAVRQHNAAGRDVIDAVWVGEPPDLPLGSADPDILIWAERAGRILISRDINTMPGWFRQHLAAGQHSPGLLLVRPGARIADLVTAMATVAHAGNAIDYFDQMDFIPFP